MQLVAIARGDYPPLEELTAIAELTGGTVFTPTSSEQIGPSSSAWVSGA